MEPIQKPIRSLINAPVTVIRSVKPVVSPHRHKYYEFVYVVEGMANQILNGEHLIISEGDYFLLAPNDIHEYQAVNNAPFCIINLCFSPTLIDSSFGLTTPFNEIMRHPSVGISPKRIGTPPFGKIFHSNDKSVYNLMLNASNEWKSKSSGYMNMLKATVSMILIKLLRNVEIADYQNNSKEFISEIVKCINEDYASDIMLSTICRKLGYNAQYVSRIFKEQMGMNFTDYLQKVRIQKACSLLLTTNLPVSQISYAVGYLNTTYFHRIFKEITGVTPHNFRNK